MRKIFAIVLSIVMIMAMMPGVAMADDVADTSTCDHKNCNHVAAIGTTYYNSLAAAISATSSSTKQVTVKLIKDTSGSGIIVAENSNFILDFNNCKYTVDESPLAGSSGTQSQCFQLLKGSTLVFRNGTIAASNIGVAMIIQNYSNLTLENMILDGTTMTRNYAYTLSNNCGTVNIVDTEIKANSNTGSVAFDVYGGFGTYDDVIVTLSGDSHIIGKIEVARVADSSNTNLNKLLIQGGRIDGSLDVEANDKTDVSVTGGTFSDFSVLPYLEENAANVTIELQSNVTENVVIPENTTVTLDLNGHTLTNKGDHTITNNGTLTIKDSSEGKTGTVDNVTHQKAALINYGTATLNGGIYKRSAEAIGNSYYTIENYGEMTLKDGVVVMQKGIEEDSFAHSSSLLHNGYYDGSKAPTGTETVDMTIDGGMYYGGRITVKNDDYGKLLVNKGTFKNSNTGIRPSSDKETDGYYVFLSANEMVIQDGIFEGDTTLGCVYAPWNEKYGKGAFEIKGGTFIQPQGANVIDIEGALENIITGGNFSSTPTDFVPAGTNIYLQNSKYYVGTAPSHSSGKNTWTKGRLSEN